MTENKAKNDYFFMRFTLLQKVMYVANKQQVFHRWHSFRQQTKQDSFRPFQTPGPHE